MIEPKLIHTLQKIVGPQHVCCESAANEVYSYDASLAVHLPDATVFPADTDETSAVVSALSQKGVAFVPRGFGTNLSGGSVAMNGGVVIGLSRLNRILSIQPEHRCATVQPGVTNFELQNALAPLGYYYAPDPASQKVSTLGGNIGENSGGPHCLKYGVTTNHVLGMTAVLPDGEIAAFGGPALDPPGCDLRGLLVGSEGTLGIVTEATVRILPKPESVVTLLAIYDDADSAAQSVSDIIAAGIVPATLEMMDAPIIEAVEKSVHCGYPLDAAAVLIIEVDGPAAGQREQADRIGEICRNNRCRSVREAKDAAERDLLWAGRRGAFGAVARLAPNYLVNDCTVPRSKLPEALTRVAEIVKKHRLVVGNVFHAGDGNLHPLVLFDSRDQDQVARVHKAGQQIMEACVELGGTISGEHGIGAEKSEAMRLVFSEDALEFQRAIKRAFDPVGLLNPDKIIPLLGKTQQTQSPTQQVASEDVRDSGSLNETDLIPRDKNEACAMVRQAFLNKTSLVPLGRGSRWREGGGSPSVRLHSTQLCSVVEYDHVNQVVTVQAGRQLAELQEVLAEYGQWLPIRPPLSDRCTVGGVVSLNASGPDRLRYGAPRDLLLGMNFVCGMGRLVNAGGRVVKNVAGYDVTRLLCGSAGTLGFLTDLTFRTLPLPECCVVLETQGPWQKCAGAASSLLDSTLEPAFVSARLVAGTDSGDGWRLSVGYEGFAKTVEDQLERSETLLVQAGLEPGHRRQYAPGDDLFLATFSDLHSAKFLARSDVPLGCLQDLVPHARDLFGGLDLFADFGCGRLYAAMPDVPGDAWHSLCRLTEEMQGHTVSEGASVSKASQYAVAREPLLRRLKGQLDPHNIFAG